MSFLKLVKLAKRFETKLQREGQAVKYVTGPGQAVQFNPNQVQFPPGQTEHEKLLSEVPPPPPEQPQQLQQTVTPKTPSDKRPSDKRVLQVQNFLNQELAVKNPVMSPITPDGVWGPETAGALKKWIQQNNLKLDLNQGFSAALGRANIDFWKKFPYKGNPRAQNS